jgi:hypothetical protein
MPLSIDRSIFVIRRKGSEKTTNDNRTSKPARSHFISPFCFFLFFLLCYIMVSVLSFHLSLRTWRGGAPWRRRRARCRRRSAASCSRTSVWWCNGDGLMGRALVFWSTGKGGRIGVADPHHPIRYDMAPLLQSTPTRTCEGLRQKTAKLIASMNTAGPKHSSIVWKNACAVPTTGPAACMGWGPGALAAAAATASARGWRGRRRACPTVGGFAGWLSGRVFWFLCVDFVGSVRWVRGCAMRRMGLPSLRRDDYRSTILQARGGFLFSIN